MAIVALTSQVGMADQDDIAKKLDELEQKRQELKARRESSERELADIDHALEELRQDKDQRVKDITDSTD